MKLWRGWRVGEGGNGVETGDGIPGMKGLFRLLAGPDSDFFGVSICVDDPDPDVEGPDILEACADN